MNTQEYIASGILESYILGSVSVQEKQEVECLSKIYPEIKTELTALEVAINAYSTVFEKAPPTHLKAKIFSQMQFAEPIMSTEEVEEDTIVESDSISRTKVMPLWPKFAAAAAVVLGILLGVNTLNTNKLKVELAALQDKATSEKTESENTKSLLAFYQDSDNQLVKLAGVEKSPESSVSVFWNQKTNDVNLIVENLPKSPEGKQYQLWTIVDGVPVDMGMLDNDFSKKVLRMKNANGNIAAFAITLEKKGGSPTPTLEEMYVIGNV